MSASSSPAAPVHRILITPTAPSPRETLGPSASTGTHRHPSDQPVDGSQTSIIDSHLGNAPGDETVVPGESAAAETMCPHCGQRPDPQVVATSSVSAEAEQGPGPGAASASASAVGESTTHTNTVSVVVGPHGAAAACPFGVVVVGPDGAAAASEVGVAAVGRNGAASACNAANGSNVTVHAPKSDDGAQPTSA